MGRDYSYETPLYHETTEKVTDYGNYLIEMVTYRDGVSFIHVYNNEKRGFWSAFSEPRLLMSRKMRKYSEWNTTLKSMLFELEYDQYQMELIETDGGYISIDYEYEAKKRRSKASGSPSPVQEEELKPTLSNKPEEIKFFTVTDWQTKELTHVPANYVAETYLELGGNPEEADKYVILNGQIRSKQQIGNLKQFQNII